MHTRERHVKTVESHTPPRVVGARTGPAMSGYLRELASSGSSSFASTSYAAEKKHHQEHAHHLFQSHLPTKGKFFIPSAREKTENAAATSAAAGAAAVAGKVGVSPAIKAVSGSFGGIIEVRHRVFYARSAPSRDRATRRRNRLERRRYRGRAVSVCLCVSGAFSFRLGRYSRNSSSD